MVGSSLSSSTRSGYYPFAQVLLVALYVITEVFNATPPSQRLASKDKLRLYICYNIGMCVIPVALHQDQTVCLYTQQMPVGNQFWLVNTFIFSPLLCDPCTPVCRRGLLEPSFSD